MPKLLIAVLRAFACVLVLAAAPSRPIAHAFGVQPAAAASLSLAEEAPKEERSCRRGKDTKQFGWKVVEFGVTTLKYLIGLLIIPIGLLLVVIGAALQAVEWIAC